MRDRRYCRLFVFMLRTLQETPFLKPPSYSPNLYLRGEGINKAASSDWSAGLWHDEWLAVSSLKCFFTENCLHHYAVLSLSVGKWADCCLPFSEHCFSHSFPALSLFLSCSDLLVHDLTPLFCSLALPSVATGYCSYKQKGRHIIIR